MNFMEIANTRQSCRSYDPDRLVEKEKLQAVLEAGRLAPSACNGQPYHITVCLGKTAKEVAAATVGLGMNRFASQAPVMLVISERPYCKTAGFGSRVKKLDYRSMDIGILAAYITAEAAVLGLSTCILGWLDEEKIHGACGMTEKVHLVICLGYPGEKDKYRTKIRKELSELVTYIEEE